jgi:hypothetical protein
VADPLDRDRSIEHLLRQTLPASTATTPCLDAEQLAAWVSGGLAPSEAEAAERHLADCADCQAMLAVFAESESQSAALAAPAAVLPFRQRWSATWLVSAAAAAAVVLVWVAVPRDVSDVPQAATTMARVEEQGAASPAGVTSGPEPSLMSRGAAAAASPPMPVEPRLQPGRSLAQESSSDSNQARSATGAQPLSEPAAVQRRFAAGAVQGPLTAKSFAATSAAAAPPPPPPSPAPLPTAGFSPAAPPLPTAAAERSSDNAAVADASPGLTSSEAARFEAAPTSLSAIHTAVRANLPVHAQTTGQRAVEFSAPASSATTGGRAAAPSVTWRIAVDGRVSRSVAGASWTPAPLAPSTFITAGSAPTQGVCWLAGRDGIVFRSTDDATFVRVAFPELEAVAAIRALDASTATVTLVSGRVFTTADGGRSWRFVP